MYRAHFCAGCHSMVEFGGRLSSLLTNYDVTFWLWLATALEEHGGRRLPPERRPCTAVPFRRVWVHPLQPRVARAVAALNLALVASKIEDNRRDGEHRLVTFAFRPLHKPARQALATLEELGFPAEAISQLAQRQSLVEAAADTGLEEACAPTRELMGEIFAWLSPLTGHGEPGPLRRVGATLGRLLYLLDALTDIEKDRDRSAFNALHRAYGYPLPHAPVSSTMHAALADFEAALGDVPLGQTDLLAQGMVDHLRSLMHQHLARWRRPGTAASSRWGAWRHLPLAGFLRPVQPADCDCGGCDGCGDACTGCDGCSSCGDCSSSCDGCSSGCSGCSGGDKIECCCDTSSCACDACNTGPNACDCCCCWSSSQNKKAQYNVTPESKPTDTEGNWEGGSDPKKGKKKGQPDPLKPGGDLAEGVPRPGLVDDSWDPSAPPDPPKPH